MPTAIRDTLTEAHIDAGCKLARFVTVEAYQAAGGAVLRDLFDADSAGWITDPALLNRLAAEKLERRSGKRSRPRLEMGRNRAGRCMGYAALLRPHRAHADRAAADALDKLHAERDKIDDEDSEQAEKLFAKIEKLESEIDFTAEDKSKERCHRHHRSADGELEIIDGLVRQEDRAAAKKKKAEANGEDGNAPPCFSSKLIEDLTAHRTAALQAMLADNPKVALAAVVHAMALGVFYDERDASRLQITPRVVYLDRHAEGMDGTEAAKQLAATTKAMRKRLPKQASKLWAWLQNQQQKTLLALLAVCAGHTVDAVAKNGGDSGEHGRAACRSAQARHGGLLAADSSRVFQPRVERADARRHRGRVRCQRQGRLRHAQENGACRRGGGQATRARAGCPNSCGRHKRGVRTGSGSDAGAGVRAGWKAGSGNRAAVVRRASAVMARSCAGRFRVHQHA